MQNNVKIARWRAVRPRISLVLVSDPRTIFHACRHRYVNGVLAHHACLAFALAAWIGNDPAQALACRARPRHGEETLLISNLAATTARGTGGRSLIGGRPGALAVLTGLIATDLYLCLLAKGRFLKRKIQVSASITATLLPSAAATAATNIHAKEVTEYVAK